VLAYLQTCPRGVADRVNLGLIPSSEPGWSVACAALKADTGGFLHVHGNVTDSRGKSCKSLMPASSRTTAADDDRSPAVEPPMGDWSSSLPCGVVEQTDVAPVSDDIGWTATKSETKVVPSNSVAETVEKRTMKFAKSRKTKEAWLEWAKAVCRILERHLAELHNRRWCASVMHVEHVKSYAPHVDHIVADIRCTPQDCRAHAALVD
jgi:tRNA wybutosine-synthesizing protein 2